MKLNDIAEIIMGQSPAGSDVYSDEIGMPLLNGPTEFTDFNPKPVQYTDKGKKFAEEGDILFCVRGSVGRMNIADQKYAIGRGLAAIRGKNQYPTKYVELILKQQLTLILQSATGSTFPNVSKDILGTIEIANLELSYVHKITEIFSSIDKKIQLNTQTNQTLEQIAQTIFKSWFIDFDPVKAKATTLAEGKTAEQANLVAMATLSGKDIETLSPAEYQQLWDIAEAFPSEMVENEEFGEVPKGWEVKAFGKLLSHTIGGDWGKDESDEKHTEKVFIFRGTDLPDVYQGNDQAVPIRFVDAKKLKTRKLQAGDIVIEVSGGSKNQPTGCSLFVTETLLSRFPYEIEPASFCRLFRPQNLEIGLLLGLHLQMIYTEGKTWEYQNQSTGIANFQTSFFLENEMIILPTKIILSAFYEMVNPLLTRIHSSENKTLSEIRDKLLPKLLSGAL